MSDMQAAVLQTGMSFCLGKHAVGLKGSEAGAEAAMVLRGTGKRKDLLVIYVLRLPLIIDTLLIGVMVSTLTSSVALYGYNL